MSRYSGTKDPVRRIYCTLRSTVVGWPQNLGNQITQLNW